MAIALRDLDTGLFYDNGQWTVDTRLAQAFPDRAAVEKVVSEQKIKNAEIVFLEGDPPRVVGGARIRISN